MWKIPSAGKILECGHIISTGKVPYNNNNNSKRSQSYETGRMTGINLTVKKMAINNRLYFPDSRKRTKIRIN